MKNITVQELKSKMDLNEPYQLIDIREIYEVEQGSINGEHIPMGEVLNNLDKIRKDVPVIIHCRAGSRSANVVRYLEAEFGLNNLYNLEGGIMAWKNQIDPTITVG